MKDGSSVTFNFERTYRVSRPKFKLFKNVEFLDARKLGSGSHVIELGKFEGCHCDCAVTGNVKNGMLTGINYPKCEKAIKLPAKFAKMIAAAGKKLRKKGSGKWQNIPVVELTRSAAARRGIVVVVTTDGDCYEVCIDPGTGLQTCWICCPGWCIGPSDPHPALM